MGKSSAFHRWRYVLGSRATGIRVKVCIFCGTRRERLVVQAVGRQQKMNQETFTTTDGKVYKTFGKIPIPCPRHDTNALHYDI